MSTAHRRVSVFTEPSCSCPGTSSSRRAVSELRTQRLIWERANCFATFVAFNVVHFCTSGSNGVASRSKLPLAGVLSGRRVVETEYPWGIVVVHRRVAEGREGMSMATVNLTAKNFAEVLSSNDIVLVDFWASWCGPCRAFAPLFEAASAEYPEIVFAKVDTEAERELAGSFAIMAIPTLMVFREQALVYSRRGALAARSLADLIGQVQALDMDEVHRQLAAAATERSA